MRLGVLLLAIVLTPLTALAADIDGRWNGTVSTPDGEFLLSCTFHVEPSKAPPVFLDTD